MQSCPLELGACFNLKVPHPIHVSEIEEEYQRRVAAMSIKEKMSRSAAMLAWTRQQMAIRIRAKQPDLSDEQLKWQVALEMYQSEPEVVAMINRYLENVSG